MPVTAATEPRPTSLSADLSQRSPAVAWVLFAALLLAACAWILSLPVFPSQDGPAHVYYAKVTRDLLAGHATYAQEYRVARPLPPYSVHAYVLMALLQWTSSEMAEKLLACLAIIVCGGGLAYFARQIGRSAPIACALAVPFLLNRFLFLGFYGYQIGVGLALFAAGMWFRDDRGKPARLLGFVLLTALTLFGHPVPYLMLIVFCWTVLGIGWLTHRQGPSDGNDIGVPTRREVITLLLATAFFAYVKHYSHSGALWNNDLTANLHDRLFRIIDVFRTEVELPLLVPVYNLVLGAALVTVSVAVCWRVRRESRQGKLTRAQLAVACALLVLIALPFLPRTMNGSGFFADRFSLWPPLLLFAAASGCELRRKTQWALSGAAIALMIVTLAVLNAHIAPIARELDVSAVPPGNLRGLHVFTLNDGWIPMEFTYVPYTLAAIRVVDRGEAILVDSPWMDLQIMMLDEIGPKVKFDDQNGPRIVSGPQVRLGVVMAHCGVTDHNGTAAHIAARHPDKWRLMRYGCFEVLQPVP